MTASTRDPTGKTGKHVDGSGMVRGWAWSLLTGYTDWDDIVIYDDYVTIKPDHPHFKYDLIGRVRVVWVTDRHDGTYGIHCWGKSRDFGCMHHANTYDEAIDKFHRFRGKAPIQSTLF